MVQKVSHLTRLIRPLLTTSRFTPDVLFGMWCCQNFSSGLGKEIFCGDHKAADMVEISNRPCIYPG